MNGPGLGDRVASAQVLAALKEIDPAADLVHLGGDQWWLGVRGQNREAEGRLQREMLATQRAIRDSSTDPLVAQEEGKRLQMLAYMAQGFRPIALYAQPEPDQRIVDDFRTRDFNWRTREREAHQELREAVSLDAGNLRRARPVREWAQQEAGFWHRHIFRRAVSTVVGALPFTTRRRT